MCRPERPEGKEAAEKAPAEAANQGPPNHVAAALRQPPRHDRGQRESMIKKEHMIIRWLRSCQEDKRNVICRLQWWEKMEAGVFFMVVLMVDC